MRPAVAFVIAVVLGAAASAQAARPVEDPFVGHVTEAFQGLGMGPARARCYGEVLLTALDEDSRDRAVALLRSSKDGSDVRRKVTAGGLDLIGGFLSASRACPESLG